LYGLPLSATKLITKLNYLKKNLGKNYQINENDFSELIIQIKNYLLFFLSEDKEFVDDFPENEVEIIKNDSNYYNFRAIVLEKRIKKSSDSIKVLICLAEGFGKFYVKLNQMYDYIYNLVDKSSVLQFIGLSEFDIQRKAFEVTENSYIVYEPDMLVDITDVAECFNYYGANPFIFFTKILSTNNSNYFLLRGNIVNSLFDDLISKASIDFETSFNKSLKVKPIRLLLFEDETALDQLKTEAKLHYENISKKIEKLPQGLYFIEPSFISYDFGIQGRLDLLIQSNLDERQKEVVELKSSKSPQNNLKVTQDSKVIYLNTWYNHSAQASGYNLLLESVFQNRRGNSSIFYSSDTNEPIRNVINEISIKQEFIKIRNLIIYYLIKFSKNEIDIFEQINKMKFNDKLIEKTKQELLLSLKKLEPTELQYFKNGIRFIIREDLYNKLYSVNSSENFVKSNLTFQDKLDNFTVLNNLKLLDDKSDFDLLHLYFEFPEKSENINFFRRGDQCLIYPDEFSEDPTKFFIFKGFITEITNKSVKISLLNKSLNLFLIDKYEKWNIEIDRSDSLIRKQLASFHNFLNATKRIKDLILGFKHPEFLQTNIPKFDYLNLHSQKILEQAINAQDYFLIQGPPGTGKTSRMLKALSEYYLNYSTKKILICAYTNRAVDEICSVLNDLREDFPYIRISSKDTGKQSKNSLPYLSDILTLEALKDKIEQTRFYVSTVSSLYTTPEIFELVKFDILILDEASQVLETQIVGILSNVDKFILIGDEKQLPAIVLQNEETEENLNEIIGFESFSHSLFSRLIKNAQKKGWNDVYSFLTHQGRMNQKIQSLANHLTYNNQLQVVKDNLKQIKLTSDFNYSKDVFLNSILSDRVVFVNSPIESNVKFNKAEINLVSKFINKFIDFNREILSEKTIGVISPFRLQCREIIKKLPEEFQDKILVDTVERYQGSERDIIILSMGTNYKTLLSKISNEIEIENKMIDRKLNVAITRAKEHLIILGNKKLLSELPVYRTLINWIQTNAKFVEMDFLNKI
jgi:DNA replication ATP-dependent helicase Dna2